MVTQKGGEYVKMFLVFHIYGIFFFFSDSHRFAFGVNPRETLGTKQTYGEVLK